MKPKGLMELFSDFPEFCQCGVGDPAAELAAVERMVRSDPSGRTPLCQQVSQVCVYVCACVRVCVCERACFRTAGRTCVPKPHTLNLNPKP